MSELDQQYIKYKQEQELKFRRGEISLEQFLKNIGQFYRNQNR